MRNHETYQSDLSGLKVRIPGISTQQINRLEAENIARAIQKYLFSKSRRKYLFDLPFCLKLHKEMFGNVWNWAGQVRTSNLNLGSPAHSIHQDLFILQRDLEHMEKDLTTAVILHHRAVSIHPFQNGNGRWSRLLSNIWLHQHGLEIVRWPASLDKESDIRAGYIRALKQADGLDYSMLLDLCRTYQSD